ncbi:TrmH family RNA methyltransferase [Butyrivibrio sp. NC3005]|uniref:TrmH family RNA methyltransferase n=1 Tax=Butyrivibrio sp. NC3005 TaxID=1280685 RepID=UPI00041E8E2D|nr:RNA methyltransferase [Butyrivibrio sp. NC3005]
MLISSLSNDRIKKASSYVQNAKARKKDKVYVVEGIRMNVEVPVEDIVQTYVSESFLKKMTDKEKLFLKNLPKGYDEVTDEVFRKMSDTKTPQGVLSIVRQNQYTFKDILKPALTRQGTSTGNKPLILILEDIQDPGNLGTILRGAEGAGVSGIILSRGCADVYNPKVVRSTMGAIFREPFIYCDNLLQEISKLKENGIITYAAHLDGKSDYDELDFTRGCAFLIGNEGNGLSKEVADAADEYLLIPMLGQVESMNAATSAAILTFEAARQRRTVK